jgi:CMP-N-acetylneuraminic acid synthetase
MKFLAVIPARKGSKGIPGKNLHALNGKPLVQYTIEAALSSSELDRVIVSTDDEKIISLSAEFGVESITRPPELATDTATTQSVILHAIEKLTSQGYFPEAIVTLQPTSPLRTNKHIDQAIRAFRENPEADSLVSCVPIPHIYHPDSAMKLNAKGYLTPDNFSLQPTRRQDKRTVYARNGAAIYITKSSRLSDYIFGGNLMPFEMSVSDSLDIDIKEDLEIAEYLLRKRESLNSDEEET